MDAKLNDYYADFILQKIPLVLTQVDRDKDSKTFGSCDRNFWHLKIRDFSSAILQQTSLTLALLYKVNFKDNIYYNNEIVKSWAIGALKYLGKIQLKDGSYNEYYPNEHGYPPTAFTLFAACRTYIELGIQDSDILNTLKKSAYWLARRRETKAYNQEWAAIAGIYLYKYISQDHDIELILDQKVQNILKIQSNEGWFPEQGGADIGYSSVALDMMAEYYWYSKDKRVEEALNKLVEFLQYFVHPDGTIGGEYGSRNTIYFMPNGLETVARLELRTSGIADAMLVQIYGFRDNNASTDFMNAVDERYLSHYVMHSYLRALQKTSIIEKNINDKYFLPCQKEHINIFREAGLLTYKNGENFVIISGKKGGLIKVYKNNKEITWDCGYRIKLGDGKVAATNWLDNSYSVQWDCSSTVVCEVNGKFNVIKQKVQNPIYHLGLRIAALMLGDKVNKLIKRITIFSDKHIEVECSRKIAIENDQIDIIDQIHGNEEIVMEEANNISLRLVASGKFFSKSDLLKTDFEKYSFNKTILIHKKVDLSRGTIKQEKG